MSANKKDAKSASTTSTTKAGTTTTGPAASPNSTFTPKLPPLDQLLPTATLRITTSLGATFDGILHCYDPAAQLLIVELTYEFDDERNYHSRASAQQQSKSDDGYSPQAEAAVHGEGKKDFSILHTDRIQVELLSPASSTTPPTLPPLSLPAITQKMDQRSQERKEEVQSIGIGVAPEIQKLFDAIRKTTPCVWAPDYQAFIVMDSVRVAAPFTSASCTSIAPAQTTPNSKKSQAQSSAQAAAAEVMLTRVKKLIDGERAKLKLKL